MTPQEFFQRMAGMPENETAQIKLPMPIEINHTDIWAAKMILWLAEQKPDITLGEVEAILDSARWWSVFWASALEAK